jgi:hypothetical protein
MEIMGNRVYLHAPTGKLFLEIGKSPASSQGINIVGTQEGMEAESGNDGSGPAKRKRRAAG